MFWSVGAAVCVALADIGCPYWANILITWIASYGSLAVTVHFLTPLTDACAKNACRNIWRWAEEEPVPKGPTLGAFNKSLILNRHEKSMDTIQHENAA